MTSALSPAETCRKVADIIDFEPKRLDMRHWECYTSDCGTTACIAGHVGLLHHDGMATHPTDTDRYVSGHKIFYPNRTWKIRQAVRLGLTVQAGEEMFTHGAMWRKHNPYREPIRFSKVLRQLGKELEDRDENNQFINRRELNRIAKEALA